MSDLDRYSDHYDIGEPEYNEAEPIVDLEDDLNLGDDFNNMMPNGAVADINQAQILDAYVYQEGYVDNQDDNNSSLHLSDSTEDVSDDEYKHVKFDKSQQLKMIYMRSFLDKVNKKFKEKDQITRNVRTEVVNCKQRLSDLERKRDEIYEKIQSEENITVSNRLQAEHANICDEIELETRVLEKLNDTFANADYERSKALLEKSKYTTVDGQLRKSENLVQKQKESVFYERKKGEDEKLTVLKKRLEKSKQIEQEKVQEESQRQREAIDQAKLARQVTAKYLQKTLRQMKEKSSLEENQAVQGAEIKRNDLLGLKHTIDHNKEMLQSKSNKKRFEDMKKEELLEREKKEIEDRGENPNFYIPRKLKLEEVENQKIRFELDQEKNRKEIVKKILSENQNMERKKVLYPNLFNINLKPLKPKQDDKYTARAIAKLATSIGVSDDQINNLIKKETPFVPDHQYERRSFCDSTTIASRDDDDSDFDELANQEDVVYKPEFEGLWNKQVKKYDADDFYKMQQKFPGCFKSKSEKELFLKSLDKLKKSSVREQVAAGRKFKGSSFQSQPKIIHFKDFTVGETYNMKVVLTNISYTINTCKLVDLTERLKDFITIDYKPPGQLSAGLTCEFNVKFEPKINVDLDGEINFLASNGPFSVPIKCTVKKCDLSVNTDSIYFGTTVIGESLNRKIQLINKGALGTNFKLLTLKEFDKPEIQDQTNPVGETGEEKFEELRIGDVREGFIGPFSTVELEFLFSPSFPGKFNEQFVLKFDDENSKEINLTAKATAIDVPIWLENINIDLKICMYDRLYQDVIRVHNRASTALRITFDVPSDLKNHLEILPKTAFIQAKSDFSAQLKFVAKSTLANDASKYFDALTGVLEVPLFIKVADQNKTVNYSLHAIVTTSDLEFDVQDIDFGFCTVYETVTATVNLTNKSILCQPFGFVKLPEYVNVQPNDGFGTLLPNETIPIDINFCPNTAKEFKFSVVCKSLVNREFVINCHGVGVLPPLKLSAQRINFKATALNSTSSKAIYVINDHLDYDQHRHPVPRIGNGEMATVGPTYFEFDLPENCPFMLSPTVGLVEPGKKVKITIEYKAELSESDVRNEAALVIKDRLAQLRALKAQADQKSNATQEEVDTKDAGKKKNKAPLKSKPESAASNMNDVNARTPDPDSIEKGSQDYLSGRMNAMEKYKGDLRHFQIPCYVSTVESDHVPSEPIKYSLHNTLYLDVICPSIRPELVVLSKDQNVIDFGKVSIGHKSIRKIGIKNITQHIVDLESSLLDPVGPFKLLNALKPIRPGEFHNLIFAFEPARSAIFQESFELRTRNSNLSFVLKAIGVDPSFTLSYEGNTLDFGYCLANDKLEKTVEMKNNSNVPIEFKVTLDSMKREVRSELETSKILNMSNSEGSVNKSKVAIGPKNYSGYSTFDVNPIQAVIPAGQKTEIKITFAPDHTSDLYADVMRISLISTDRNARSIQLVGKSRSNAMYLRGVDFLTSNYGNESMILADLSVSSSNDEKSGGKEAAKTAKSTKSDKGPAGAADDVSIPKPVLVSLYSVAKNIGDNAVAEKVIYIGCMKATTGGDKKETKKNGDFAFENVKEINLKGFNIDLVKSAVEGGGERAVKITWKPPPGTDPKQTIQSSILLTTKSNCVEVWKLILQGRIVSENTNV